MHSTLRASEWTRTRGQFCGGPICTGPDGHLYVASTSLKHEPFVYVKVSESRIALRRDLSDCLDQRQKEGNMRNQPEWFVLAVLVLLITLALVAKL